VIIGGFRFDGCAALFKSLHKRMQQGLRVTMFVDIDGEATPPDSGKSYAERFIRNLLARNWPFGAPYPEVFYDPQSAVVGPPWVSMHAKCIVVDEMFSFITSANFTARGQTRNIEVGVCIEDRDFAERLSSQWRGLVGRGLVERYASEHVGLAAER
jgi:phosphatidylserine/phosphatidylglycerophosphate/cardiolipin synthase-like enzyme